MIVLIREQETNKFSGTTYNIYILKGADIISQTFLVTFKLFATINKD